MNTSPHRQRGVALLVALLVVALAVILIAALLDRGELAFARTRNLLRSEQADAYAQGLEIYAAQILFKTESEQRGPDSNRSPWALPLPPQQVPGGLISATMRDLNGCFNLNNLSGRSPDAARWLDVFNQLLLALGIPDPMLAASVQAWLGAGDGANVLSPNTYLSLPIPYRQRGDVFVHVSELRLVAGVTTDVYAKLAPYVCALPPGTKINVNTASVPVLQSLTSRISRAAAIAIWNNGQANMTSVTDVATQAHIDQSLLPPASMIGTSSTYFLARGDIILDEVPFTFYSLIERAGNGHNYRVLARSRGSDDALTVAAPIAASPRDDGTLD
ncbi:MAG: type II secretion system minor pseudopilin GspK [Dokdonella sp.]